MHYYTQIILFTYEMFLVGFTCVQKFKQQQTRTQEKIKEKGCIIENLFIYDINTTDDTVNDLCALNLCL